MSLTSIAAAAFLAIAQANSLPADNTAEDVYIDDLNRALDLARNENCTGALDIMLPALQSPLYETLNAQSKTLIHRTVIDCAIDERRWLEALDSIEAHLILRGDTEYMLWLKLVVGNIADQPLKSLAAVERLTELAPERLHDLELRTVYSLLRKLKESQDGDERLAFLDLLWAVEYRPPDPIASLDTLRLTYARLLRDEHMTARAAALIKEIENPLVIADFLIDKRFDPVRNFQGLPTLQDMPALVVAYVDKARRKTESYPKHLSAQLDYVQALRLSGAFAEAESQAAAVVSEMGENAEDSAYEDYDEQAPWVLNEWAYTLYDLGRNDEARTALTRAAAKDERGQSNVSQLINLSSLLQAEGKYDEAISQIGKLDLDVTSAYGEMWAKTVVVCARAFQDRLDEAADDLAYIRANGEDNVSALQRTLLCINDLDGAAVLYIERLNDPDQRGDALNALQTTLKPPYVLPGHATLQRRFETVKARADVQNTASEVGRVLDLPFYPTYWGDF